MQTKLSQFLLSYRTTPNSTTRLTPSELFLKRRIRTRLDLLKPQVATWVERKQALQKQYHDKGSRMREFDSGQRVLVENLRGEPKWLPGTIIEKAGSVSYHVQVGEGIWWRHADQIMSQKDGRLEKTEVLVRSSTEPLEGSDVSSSIPKTLEAPTNIQQSEPPPTVTMNIDPDNEVATSHPTAVDASSLTHAPHQDTLDVSMFLLTVLVTSCNLGGGSVMYLNFELLTHVIQSRHSCSQLVRSVRCFCICSQYCFCHLSGSHSYLQLLVDLSLC